MLARHKFIEYVKNGGSEPFVSLQIGAGAGFDTKLAGKRWNSETTLEDTLNAYEIVGCEPLFNIGLPDLSAACPNLRKVEKRQDRGSERVIEFWLETPYGQLYWKNHEVPKQGVVPLTYPVDLNNGTAAFDIVRWYADQHIQDLSYLSEQLSNDLKKLQRHGPVSVQWNLQPFELFGLPTVDNLVMLAMIHPEEFRKCCDHVRDVNLQICKSVFDAGTDFVFLGGPGSEMLSPQLYKEYLIPDSKIITDYVHSLGGLIYTHICSPVQPFLDMKLYNEMGLDLFETLSPPPVGNVKSLADARKILPANMCTRGNIGLDLLLNGNVAEVEQATIAVIEATRGYKHMIAASDYLFYDIPLENVKAIVNIAKQ